MAEYRYTVAIVQETLSHYRYPFFEGLRSALHARGIRLVLVYGQPDEMSALKGDTAEVAWGHRIRNRSLPLFNRRLVWQPCLRLIRSADLVVVEQASRLLLNYLLLLNQRVGRPKVAFWGHGRNLRTHTASSTGEAIKRFVSNRVHWWFAYNEMSARIVKEAGFAPERVTDVQNTIDTTGLRQAYDAVTDEQVASQRQALGIEGNNVCVFIGGMYPEKRLDFLIRACRLIRDKVPDFQVVFAGGGSDAEIVEDASKQHPWMHYAGPVFGDEKAHYLRMSKLLLMPGLVGLAVLDAIATATPLVTTDVPYHSPEISYLRDGVNGVVVRQEESVAAFADAVAELLVDPNRLENLRTGCRVSSERFTMDEMVKRFADGIESALKVPLRKAS